MNPITNNQSPITDLPDDVVLSVRNVSKKFCRNLRRSMIYGMQDLAGNMLGLRPGGWERGELNVNRELVNGNGRLQDVGLRETHAASRLTDNSATPPAASPLPPLRKDEFWALENASFDLKRGETLGLIGSNGSGKSTMLRILTGIFPPDVGQISVRGRVGALIALGAGFHPHLTGRENIHLNGAILGMKKEEVDAKFQDIVSFSEIGSFLDAPVSTYSSGMHARLGFSIAVHVQPDLLLVDEVLSVGDMAFQTKCSERMHEFVKAGGTVVFVSHNLNMVQSLCERVIWIERGHRVMDGPAPDVVSACLESMDRRSVGASLEEIRRHNAGTGDIRIMRTVLRNQAGQECQEFGTGDALTVEIHYETAKRILEPYFWVGIDSQHGSLFGANMLFDGCRPAHVEGKGVISCTFKFLPLLPQSYSVWGGIRPRDGAMMLVQTRRLSAFQVTGKTNDLGFTTKVAESLTRGSTPVLVPYVWHLPDGSTGEPSLDGLWRSQLCASER